LTSKASVVEHRHNQPGGYDADDVANEQRCTSDQRQDRADLARSAFMECWLRQTCSTNKNLYDRPECPNAIKQRHHIVLDKTATNQ